MKPTSVGFYFSFQKGLDKKFPSKMSNMKSKSNAFFFVSSPPLIPSQFKVEHETGQR